MTELVFNKCLKMKDVDEFYINNRYKTGYTNKCKECIRKEVRENRERNIDYYKEYDRKRANRPDRVKARAEYQKTEKGIEAGNRAKLAYTLRNAKKRWASTSVGNAVRDGKLIRPKECSQCGKTSARIHGHHDDYDKPLDVRWLCPACHSAWHKEHGEAKNAR